MRIPARAAEGRRAGRRLAGHLALIGLFALTGCGPLWLGRRATSTDARPAKLTRLDVRVPSAGEPAPLVGRMQSHRVAAGETLLEVARDAGLGFHELRDANPNVDEWVPPANAEVVVPTRWILPRSRSRGIVVNIPEMRLYLFPSDAAPGREVPLITWAIGIGTEEAPSPVGPFTVRSKDANPTWIVPDSIYRTMDAPQRVVPPGPENPLGAYRMRLSKGLYSIHGTNDPWSIGRLTTHGCIRLYPEDIAELYPLVRPGMTGELVYQPVKVGAADGRVLVEVHEDVYGKIGDLQKHARVVVQKAGLAGKVDPERLRLAVQAKTGVPTDVTRTTAVATTGRL